MKAQSAIEYLTTYGWMLIGVSIIGGALYQFSSSGCEVEAQGLTGNELMMTDAAITSDNKFSVAFSSSSNRKITIKEVEIGNGSLLQTRNLRLQPGESKAYDIAQTEDSDSCETREIMVSYDIGPVKGQKFYGEITAPAEFIDIVVDLLDVGGGEISELRINSTIKPETSDICFGDNCNLNTVDTGNNVKRSGDTMTGALITGRLEFNCIGDNCASETGSFSGNVSNVNNTMDGTLKISDISDKLGMTISGYQ